MNDSYERPRVPVSKASSRRHAGASSPGFLRVAGAMLASTAFFATALVPLPARAEDPRTIALVDQTGQAFRFADLRGNPTLVTFVATRCTDACPIANVAFARLNRRLREDHIAARLVTVTLDPDYDTPFVMAGLARSFSANPARWAFASGHAASVRRLMRSFGVIAEKDKNGVPDVHGSFVYLLDRHVRLQRTLLLSTGLETDAERALRTLPADKR